MVLMARVVEQIFAGFLHIPASGVFCPGLYFLEGIAAYRYGAVKRAPLWIELWMRASHRAWASRLRP